MIKILPLLFACLLFLTSKAQSFEEIPFLNDDYPFHDEIEMADLDGDGDQDIVAVSSQQRILTIGNYNSDNNTLISDTLNTIFHSSRIELFDIDADGLIDIVVSAVFEDASYYWKNLGNFSFEKTSTGLVDYTGIHVVDLNNDGTQEMIVSSDDKVLAYTLDNGSINFYTEVDPGGFSFRPKAITSFDKNGDGMIDLLASDDFDGIIYYEQQGDGSFSRTDLLPEVFSVEHLEVADFNNDGYFDIFAQSAFNGSAKIQINNGDDTFTELQIPTVIERIDLAFVIDYDSNGDEDVMFYDSGFGATGVLNAYVNDGGSFSVSEFSTSYGKVETGIIGDIDSDGAIDMLIADNDFFDPAIVLYKNNLSVETIENTLTDFKAFPTLVQDVFTLSTNENLEVSLCDNKGALLINDSIEGTSQYSLENYPAGMYYVKLQNHNSKAIVKIIKL